jgi:hypothetical protein
MDVEYVSVIVTSFERDEGTLVLFSALSEDEEEVTIALLPGCASDLMDGLMRGERPEIEIPWYLVS